MAQTYFPDSLDVEDKPRPMLFDGWGFVPMPETDLITQPAETVPELQDKAPA